jgi:hypothetical protein
MWSPLPLQVELGLDEEATMVAVSCLVAPPLLASTLARTTSGDEKPQLSTMMFLLDGRKCNVIGAMLSI